MREDYKPGDLSVRLQFGRVYGGGPDRGKIKPGIEIVDECSGKQINIELTAEQLAEMLGGGAAQVDADKVSGFKGLRDWGKTQEMVTRMVDVDLGDWKVREDDKAARTLPHVAAVIAEIEADGYRVDAPRRNNNGKWVLIGRRYVEKP
jgi:hypothetical protein